MMNISKNTIDVEISSANFNFSCKLRRRITVIRGDSGVGKTSLTDIVRLRGGNIKVTAPFEIYDGTSGDPSVLLSGSHNAIYIFDDLDVTESGEFAKLCKKYLVKNNLYVVIISRVNLTEEELSGISEFKTDGINHWLVPTELSRVNRISAF